MYVLYRGSRPLFAGVAAGATSMRAEILAHLRGDFGSYTRSSTHAQWRATASALKAYRMQLAAHGRWDLRGAWPAALEPRAFARAGKPWRN